MKLIFWISAGWVFYTYVGYPALLLILASMWQVTTDLRFLLGRRNRRRRRDAAAPAQVTVCFSAYNEGSVIAAKMRNCGELEYPAANLEILVGCDGCSDRTAALARAARLPNARILEFRERSGKPAVINRLAEQANGDILVFTDANTMIHPDALRQLLRHFSDPEVGCVCGELRLRPVQGGAPTEGIYWRYEVFLKFLESRLNMVLGANGALFAVRRELFEPVPQLGVIDDFLIAMRVRAKGFRIVYDPEAVGEEELAPDVRHEFKRRVRIGAGNFYALRYTSGLLNPAAGMVALAYWSHKVFRWIAPIHMAAALITATLLAGDPFYATCALAGAAIGVWAWLGYRLELRKERGAFFRRALFTFPYYFLSMHIALLFGLVKSMRGTQTVIWNPTVREMAAVDVDEQESDARGVHA
jgi:cellulose synthase/poly-beta-1,6-N-acetylglucosamine synthase-like glycosyltransferase